MRLVCCPHCEQESVIDAPFPEYDTLTRRQQALIDCLALRPGRAYNAQQLVDYVYAGSALPANAIATIRVTICQLNKRVGRRVVHYQQPKGYFIESVTQ